MTKKETMNQKILNHGMNVLALFPDCDPRYKDPVKICKFLRKHEREISSINLANCNGKPVCVGCRVIYTGWTEEELEKMESTVQKKWEMVCEVLGAPIAGIEMHLNRDPRGYALKIICPRETNIHMDWGGFGILAPDFTE